MEALVVMQGAATPTLADMTDPTNPKPICNLSGPFAAQTQMVTQTVVSWTATQGSPGTPGASIIGVLDLLNGTSTIAASWQGGGFLDGQHAWSADRGFLAYLTSDSTAVNLHLLSGGGDRVVASLGSVPGRGVNPTEDDSYLAFSADGAYFALVQTFTSSGDQLQVRRTLDGSLAFSLPTGTMGSWGSSGSKLYFRRPNTSAIMVWDSTTGVAQALGPQLAWIQPRADAGDDNLAFTVRNAAGTPHVWLYGHSGQSGGQLQPVRSMPAWLNSTTIFYVEEAACAPNCGIGPAWQPDGKTFTFNLGTQTETASKIASVYGAWPRPGQV
ncbi:MAG: hypothetical protein ACHQ0J_12180 [Candidatus Dormibacterales bacterium]